VGIRHKAAAFQPKSAKRDAVPGDLLGGEKSEGRQRPLLLRHDGARNMQETAEGSGETMIEQRRKGETHTGYGRGGGKKPVRGLILEAKRPCP